MKKIVISTILAASLLLVGCGKRDSKDTVKEFVSSMSDADYENSKKLTAGRATGDLMELASYCNYDKTKEYFQDALKVLAKTDYIFTIDEVAKAKGDIIKEYNKKNFNKMFNDAKTPSEHEKVYDDYIELIKKYMDKPLDNFIKRKKITLKNPEITKNTIYRYLAYKKINFDFHKYSNDTRGLYEALLEELDKNGKLSLTEKCVKKYTNYNENAKVEEYGKNSFFIKSDNIDSEIYTSSKKDKDAKIVKFSFKGHKLNDLFY